MSDKKIRTLTAESFFLLIGNYYQPDCFDPRHGRTSPYPNEVIHQEIYQYIHKMHPQYLGQLYETLIGDVSSRFKKAPDLADIKAAEKKFSADWSRNIDMEIANAERMALPTLEEITGDGSFQREADAARSMYGSLKGYLSALMEQRRQNPRLTSKVFMEKSRASIKIISAQNRAAAGGA
ncbi:hypothetical protein [Rhodobacteraceae phage LS06-2018-MD07]|jgi:hypothetical protein|nr:hypothetical protein [Rhodobacteraceae phage LS06-2018-MD07]